jgi:hypothetical protein
MISYLRDRCNFQRKIIMLQKPFVFGKSDCFLSFTIQWFSTPRKCSGSKPISEFQICLLVAALLPEVTVNCCITREGCRELKLVENTCFHISTDSIEFDDVTTVIEASWSLHAKNIDQVYQSRLNPIKLTIFCNLTMTCLFVINIYKSLWPITSQYRLSHF